MVQCEDQRGIERAVESERALRNQPCASLLFVGGSEAFSRVLLLFGPVRGLEIILF